MRFPSRENDIAVLAEDLIAGLSEHTEFFPSPPATAEELQGSFQAYKMSQTEHRDNQRFRAERYQGEFPFDERSPRGQRSHPSLYE